MLHRANSDAGQRLRRAKSGSSIHQRRSEPVQASLHPEHAGVAAIEAYRRAFQLAAVMPPPRTQQRGGTQTKRRSEGSHFEESRNGNRGGVVKPSNLIKRQAKRSDQRSSSQAGLHHQSEASEVRIVTQPRRVVDTRLQDAENTRPSHRTQTQPQARLIRKSKSMYLDKQQTQHNLPVDTTVRDGGSLGKKSRNTSVQRTPQSLEQWPIVSSGQRGPSFAVGSQNHACSADIETETARDVLFQESHKRRLRASASFTDPLRRKLGKSVGRSGTTTAHDNTIPPFNIGYNGDPGIDSASSVPVEQTGLPTSVQLPRQRNVSDTIKNKFRRIFGKEKRVQTAFPAQHVSAKQFHFEVYTPDPEEESFHLPHPRRPPPLPPVDTTSGSVNDTRKCSSQSTDTAIDSQTNRSRVTSWADSTVAGTVRSMGNPKRLTSINELPSRMSQASVPSHGRSSMLGRALRFPTRRSSGMSSSRTSEDSQKLYDALRVQIQDDNPWERTSTDVIACGGTESRQASGSGTEREKFHTATLTGLQPATHSPTIRTVTPEAIVEAAFTRSKDHINSEVCQLAENGLSQRSAEHRAKRQQKALNRWQETLNDESPVASRALRVSNEFNPYRLGSLPTSPQMDYLPMVIRHPEVSHDQLPTQRRGVSPHTQAISPSVYSREADAPQSTRSNSPMPNIGTIVTITGREVKRYSLESPDKRTARVYVNRPSQD